VTTFQVESVEDWASESKDLVYAHWQELGLDLDLEIAPDFEKMAVLEGMGMFKVVTVREIEECDAHEGGGEDMGCVCGERGRLVGYLLAVVNTHLHYRNSPKMLIVDAYYVAPECRSGTGVKLVRFTEELAHQLGAIKIYFSCKVHKDHSRLFQGLGYRLSDYAFTKRVD
jgi:hypothetical protein